jgi:hypothetical protein
MLDTAEGTYWETWLKFITEHLFKFGFLSPDDFYFFKLMHRVEDAVEEIIGFYRIYHSARWVGNQLVIRLMQALSRSQLAELNNEFSDLLRRGGIVQRKALPQEKNEPELWDLPRLVFAPYRHSFGRFRQLIDAINRPG